MEENLARKHWPQYFRPDPLPVVHSPQSAADALIRRIKNSEKATHWWAYATEDSLRELPPEVRNYLRNTFHLSEDDIDLTVYFTWMYFHNGQGPEEIA